MRKEIAASDKECSAIAHMDRERPKRGRAVDVAKLLESHDLNDTGKIAILLLLLIRRDEPLGLGSTI